MRRIHEGSLLFPQKDELQQALRSETIIKPSYGGGHQSRTLWVRILYSCIDRLAAHLDYGGAVPATSFRGDSYQE